MTRVATWMIVVLTFLIPGVSAGVGRIVSAGPPMPADSTGVFAGVYASTFEENIFSPCDVPGIGSGWSIRFVNPRDAAFLRYSYPARGQPTVAHFIRVRGRVSDTGRYGIGFQNREIVVDSVLDVSEFPQPCRSYEEVARPWRAIPWSGVPIVGAAVTEDRTRVAVLDVDATISIWDVSRGLVRQFPSEDTGQDRWTSIQMQFSRDGQRLAVGGADGIVRVWNPVDGRRIWMLAGGDTMPGSVNGKTRPAVSSGLAFNKSGTLLANMIVGKTSIWSMTSGTQIGAHQGGWRPKFLFLGDSSFVASGDSRLIASGDSGLVRIYPRLGAAPIWSIKTPVQRFAIMETSSDERWLVVKSWGDTAHLWSLGEGEPGQRIVTPYGFGSEAVAFSPDGKLIAMSGGAHALYLWETATGLPVRSFQKFSSNVHQAWFTSDGGSIVTRQFGDSVFRIVHLETVKPGAADSEPLQASWAANARPTHPGGTPSVNSIYGFVRDSAGKVILGADVSIFDGDRRDSKRIGRTSTNAAGRFLLQGIKIRHIIVRAGKRGFSADTAYAHLPSHDRPVDLVLKARKP